jgi:hypothetical protein
MTFLRCSGPACFVLLSLAAVGCGGSVTASTTGGGGSGTSSGSPASSGVTSSSSGSSSSGGNPDCPVTSTSMLDGVHLEIDGVACTFSLSDPQATVSLPYHVVVDADVTGVTPRSQDAGQCGTPGESGLITFEKVSGNQQQYCLCDTGLCAPSQKPPVTLKKGSYPVMFTWDKHNWYGPSDTGNQEGATFPVGDYVLEVSAIGLHTVLDGDEGFIVSSSMPVHIVP